VRGDRPDKKTTPYALRLITADLLGAAPEGAPEGAAPAAEAGLGLGRIVALHCRASTSHQIR
jgi:hypothetical protein